MRGECTGQPSSNSALWDPGNTKDMLLAHPGSLKLEALEAWPLGDRNPGGPCDQHVRFRHQETLLGATPSRLGLQCMQSLQFPARARAPRHREERRRSRGRRHTVGVGAAVQKKQAEHDNLRGAYWLAARRLGPVWHGVYSAQCGLGGQRDTQGSRQQDPSRNGQSKHDESFDSVSTVRQTW